MGGEGHHKKMYIFLNFPNFSKFPTFYVSTSVSLLLSPPLYIGPKAPKLFWSQRVQGEDAEDKGVVSGVKIEIDSTKLKKNLSCSNCKTNNLGGLKHQGPNHGRKIDEI